MSKNMNVPKLRFSEFSGVWEEKELGDVSEYIKGFAFKSENFLANGIRIIRVSDLSSDSIKIDNEKVFIAEEKINNYEKYKIIKGNIIITTVGSNPDLTESAVGRGIYINEKNIGLLNQNMLKLENTDKSNNKFIYTLLNTPKYITHIKSIKRGNANQANITVKELFQYKIFIPLREEQEKIASFLTSVDTKIEQLTKKEALLQEYKKGVMSKIFNQEIRFKDDDGSEFPEWEEEKIGNLFLNIGGTALEKFTDENASYKFISIGNYSRDGKYIDNGQRIILNDKTETKLLEKDNLVMVLNDKTSSGDIIGSTILIDENNKYIYNQRSERLICKKNISSLFYWHFFNSKLFRKEVFSISQGGTQIYINFSAIKLLNIPLPSLKEQTKIANFLSSCDKKIELTTKELHSTKEFKKALLQQMFV